MGAKTLNCPSCGASITSDEKCCRYCGSRLAVIACAHCFGVMFRSNKFCPHCGEKAQQPVELGPAAKCPNCRVRMKHLRIKETPLQECPKCFGIWVDDATFESIRFDREQQADLLNGLPKPRITPAPVKYRPCPRCGQLMHRSIFARSSGVIIDRCPGHGVWLDHDELRRVIEFVIAGGMELQRQRDEAEIEKLRQHLEEQARIEKDAESLERWQDPRPLPTVVRIIGRMVDRS